MTADPETAEERGDSPTDAGFPAGATGIGSMPGESVAEAVAIIAGELPDLPHIPELPALGAGADMVGRTAALLAGVSADLGVDTTAAGWRFAGGATRPVRRAVSMLGEVLDRCEEVFGSSEGAFKVQVCGPWTLAAVIESPRGGPALKDPGLGSEIAAALSEAAAGHLRDVRRRMPRRSLVIQFDEPALPAVLDGRIQTASGFGTLPGVGPAEAAQLLRAVREAAGAPAALHCCGEFPFDVARSAGFEAVSWDLGLTPEPVDPVAEAFEAGVRLLVGAVPALGPYGAEGAWRRVWQMWRRTGLAEQGLADVMFSPACGLAGTSPTGAKQALAACGALASRAAGGIP